MMTTTPLVNSLPNSSYCGRHRCAPMDSPASQSCVLPPTWEPASASLPCMCSVWCWGHWMIGSAACSTNSTRASWPDSRCPTQPEFPGRTWIVSALMQLRCYPHVRPPPNGSPWPPCSTYSMKSRPTSPARLPSSSPYPPRVDSGWKCSQTVLPVHGALRSGVAIRWDCWRLPRMF